MSPRAAVTAFFALNGFVAASFFAVAVAGLVAFSAAMTIGRVFGDRVTQRLGNERHLRAGGLVAAPGVVLAATATSVSVAVAGFALTGIGLSALFALMVRAAAGHAEDAAGPAIAAVCTVGFVAEATSLRFALAANLGLLCLSAAALASVAR